MVNEGQIERARRLVQELYEADPQNLTTASSSRERLRKEPEFLIHGKIWISSETKAALIIRLFSRLAAGPTKRADSQPRSTDSSCCPIWAQQWITSSETFQTARQHECGALLNTFRERFSWRPRLGLGFSRGSAGGLFKIPRPERLEVVIVQGV